MTDLADFICFRIGALSRKIYRCYNNLYAEYGITVPQSFIIFDLYLNDRSNMKDIAGRLQLDSPAITGLIDRLEKEGLVERTADPSDRRSLQIVLTRRGRSLTEKIIPLALRFNERLKEAFNGEELQMLDRSLSKLEEKLVQHSAKG